MANSSSSGVGFTGLLTIVFIVLKLLRIVQWSWFWVLSPSLFILAAALLIVALGISVSSLKD